MADFLIGVQIVSIIVLFGEAFYVFANWNQKMHGYLFLFCIATIVNNLGYLLEMVSRGPEMSLIGTQISYLGKTMIPFAMAMFTYSFIRGKIETYMAAILGVFHVFIWLLVLTTEYHHLYYTNIEFTTDGLWPHNVYTHGFFYYVFVVMCFAYFIHLAKISSGRFRQVQTAIEKKQMLNLMMVAICALLGLIVYMLGVTQGYDTTSLGFAIGSLFMLNALWRYNLMDASELAKSQILDHLTDGYVVINSKNDIVYYNDTATRIYPEIVINQKQAAETLIADYAKEEPVVRDELFFEMDEQNIYQKDVYRGTMYVLRDITREINDEKDIDKYKRTAEDAVSQKQKFLTDVAQEIRTPMNSILGIAELMMRKSVDEETENYLLDIRKSGNSLIGFVNELVDYARIENGKYEANNSVYSVKALLQDLRGMFFTRLSDTKVALKFDIDPSVPKNLEGDLSRVKQIIVNLMNNAIQHTEKGEITISLRVAEFAYGKVLLRFGVKDTGCGIKPEDQERIFDLFAKVDNEIVDEHGHGLGLSVAKQLVRVMGGEMGMNSMYGEGSDFYFTIWQGVDTSEGIGFFENNDIEDGNEKSRRHWTDSFNFRAPEARVLLVEDNKVNRVVTTALLKPLGMRIDTAENGKEAVQMITSGSYDMILMDIFMPVMDGVEATKLIREIDDGAYAMLPVIALTADSEEKARENLLAAGMDDYIQKPIKIEEIVHVIERWLPDDKMVREN
ncbi:MAG: response regulator [Lachnospiraceae bacterium]|nr:response regulator [Lachnospiraceae bacterium]